LFGEGSSAGAVRYFTRNPNLNEVDGNIEVEGIAMQDGDTDFNVRGAFSIPIVEDKVGLRLAAATFNYPGWINVVNGKKDVNNVEAKMFRAVLLAQPSENFTLRAMIHYDDSKVGSLGMYTGDVDNRSALLPLDDDRIDDENMVANLKMDWVVGNGTITSLTSYFDRDRRRQVYDQIYSVVNSLSTVPLYGIVDESFLDDTITQNQWSQ
jgi:outer membrane receptor protein involved in Fe transport